MRFEAARARAYYDESRPLLDLIHPRSRAVAVGADRAFIRACWSASNGSNYDVFRRRVRLPLWEKSWIVWRALVGLAYFGARMAGRAASICACHLRGTSVSRQVTRRRGARGLRTPATGHYAILTGCRSRYSR